LQLVGEPFLDLSPQCGFGLQRRLQARARDPLGFEQRDQVLVTGLQLLKNAAQPAPFGLPCPERRLQILHTLGQHRTKAGKVIVLPLRHFGGALFQRLKHLAGALDLGRDRIFSRLGMLLDGAQAFQDLLDTEHPAEAL